MNIYLAQQIFSCITVTISVRLLARTELDFFTASVISQVASIRDEQVVWGGMGWVVERVGSQRGVYLILGHRQQYCIFNKRQKQNTTHSIGKDSCWQQFGTTDILIDAVHWLHRPCNVPSCFG